MDPHGQARGILRRRINKSVPNCAAVDQDNSMKKNSLNTEAEDFERRIVLDGAANFRDLGGYPAYGHHRIKWRNIFRSGHLASLTENDHRVLNRLDIRSICDFRSAEEITRQPNCLPEKPSLEYLHLPIVNKTIEPTEALARIVKGDTSWFTHDFMVNAYIEKIVAFPDVWYQFFKYLHRQSYRPLLFHCTAGKDRTGAFAALILLILGVPEETVVFDHGLSNFYLADFLETIYAYLKEFGVEREKISPYLTAPHDAIVALLDHIRKQHGSAENYLISQADVSPEILDKLRMDFLE